MEIDGVAAGGQGPYCVLPGERQVGVKAESGGNIGWKLVKPQFAPGQNYRLRAKLNGISFAFTLDRLRGEEVNEETKFSVMVGSMRRSPVVIPIIVRPQ